MKPATAKAMDAIAAEELGRATLQIVHDLKNQLNGLKLYATFLRKRMDRDDRTTEERETLGKLIAGLDTAAGEMTALVRYARPVELRLSRTELPQLIMDLAELPNRDSGGLEHPAITVHVEDTAMFGDVDQPLLTEALKAITSEVRAAAAGKEPGTVSLHVHREGAEARLEWRGAKVLPRYETISSTNGCGSIHTVLAAKIIEAHRGRVQYEANVITVWLPLIDQNTN